MLALSILISFLLLILIIARKVDQRRLLKMKEFWEERRKYTKADFISDIEKSGLNVDLAIEFSLIIHEYFLHSNPDLPLLYPFLNDNLVNVWGIDEEIEDLVYIF